MTMRIRSYKDESSYLYIMYTSQGKDFVSKNSWSFFQEAYKED